MARIGPQVRIRTAEGNLTPAGRLYIANGGDENDTRLFPVDMVPWQQGRNTIGYTIPDRHGAGQPYRLWGGPIGGPQALTQAGRLHQGHKVTDVVVHMPVDARYPRPQGGWSREYSTNASGPITVPLADIPELKPFCRVYADLDPEEIKRTVMDAISLHLQHMWAREHRGAAMGAHPPGMAVGNILTIYAGSDVWYYVKVDEDIKTKPGWTIDIMTTTRTHDVPATHVILGRPLRGIIDMPDDMWEKKNLCKDAIRDFQGEGLNCVVQQIVLVCNKQYRPRDGDTQTAEKVEQFTTDDVIWNMDLIFEELYPGHFVDDDGNKVVSRIDHGITSIFPEILDKYSEAWKACLLYTSPSPRDRQKSRMPSSA